MQITWYMTMTSDSPPLAKGGLVYTSSEYI